MNRTLLGIAAAGLFFAALVYTTKSQSSTQCEVCLSYGGRQLCEVAVASDRPLAQMQATASACQQLSDGVTSGIECQNTPPISVTCTP
jgi:hypothetical protein